MSMDSGNVLNLALGAAKLPASLGNLLCRLIFNKETLGTALQRLGWSSVERRNGPVLWFNVESFGDASTALPIVLRCLQEYNEKVVVLVTTPCRVVYKLLGETLPQRVLVQLLPLDNPWTITAFLKKWHPQVGVFLDSPFQRDLVALARASGVYLALLNAHMPGEDLLEWHARHTSRRLLRQALSSYSLIVPRTYVDVGRFRMFGATLGQMPGWSTDLHQAAELGACASRLMATRRCRLGPSLLRRLAKRPLWIAANTLPGEDAVAARAHIALRFHHPRLLTLVAPQELNASPRSSEEPANATAVLRRLSAERRLQVELLRETVKSPERLTSDVDILVIDDAEALTQLYSLSEIVFVGGSLLPSVDGASSPAPAAVAGCALLVGPHAAQYLSLASDLNSAAMLASEEAAAAVAQTGATLQPITPTASATPREGAEAEAQDPGNQGGFGGHGNDASTTWQGLMAQSQRAGRTVRPMSAPPTAPDYPSSQLSGAMPAMLARFDHLSPMSTGRATAGSSLQGVSTYPTCGSDSNPASAQSGGASWGSQQVTCLTSSALASVPAAVSVGTRASAIRRFRWAAANEVIGFGYELDQQRSDDTESSEEEGENPGPSVAPDNEEEDTVVAASSVQAVKVAGQTSKISINETSVPSSADGDPHQDQTGSDPGDDAASTLGQVSSGEAEAEAPSPSQSPSLQSRYRLLQAVGSTGEDAAVPDVSRELAPASGGSAAVSFMGGEVLPSSSYDGSDSEFSSTEFYDASEELGQDMLPGEMSGFLQHPTRQQGDTTAVTHEEVQMVGDGPAVSASSPGAKESIFDGQPLAADNVDKSDIMLVIEQVEVGRTDLPGQSQCPSTAMDALPLSGIDFCRECVVAPVQADSPVDDDGTLEAADGHEEAAIVTGNCTTEELTRGALDDANDGGYVADDDSSIASADIAARFHDTRATHMGHLLVSGTGGGFKERSQPRRSHGNARHALLSRSFKSAPGLARASASSSYSPSLSLSIEAGPDEDLDEMCGPHSEAMSPVSLSTHIRSSGLETDPAVVMDGSKHNVDAGHSGPFTWRLSALALQDELSASQAGIDTCNSDISIMGMLSTRHSSTTQSSVGMAGPSPPNSATAREDSQVCARLVDSRQPSHGSLDHYLPPKRHSAAVGLRASRMSIIAQSADLAAELPDMGGDEGLVESARSSISGSVHSAAGSIVQLCDAKLLPPPPMTVVHDAFNLSSEVMSDYTPFALGPSPGDEAESDVGSPAVSPPSAVAQAPPSTRPGSLPGLRLKPVTLPSSSRNSPKGANDSPSSDFHFGLTDDGDSSSPTLLASASIHNSNGNSLQMPPDDPEFSSGSSDPVVVQTPASGETKHVLTESNNLVRSARPSSPSVTQVTNRMPSPTGSVSGSVGRSTSLARAVVRSATHGTAATGAGVYSVDSMSSWLGEEARGSLPRSAQQKSGLGPTAAVSPVPEVPRLADPVITMECSIAGGGHASSLQPTRSSADALTSAFAIVAPQRATGFPPGSPKLDQLSLILSSPRSPVSPVRTSRALSPSAGGGDDVGRPLLNTQPSVPGAPAHEGPFAALTRTLLESLEGCPESRETPMSLAKSSDSRMARPSPERGLQRHLSAPVQRASSPASLLRSVTSGQATIGLSAPSTEHGSGPDQTSSCQAAGACPLAWPSLQTNGSASSSRSSSCPGTPTSRAANNASSPFRLPTRASFDGLRQHALSPNMVTNSEELGSDCLEAIFDALVREDMKRRPFRGVSRSVQCSPYKPPIVGLSSSPPASSTSMPAMTIPEDMEVGRSLYEDEMAECSGKREREQDEESPPLSPRADSYNVLFSPKLPQEESQGAKSCSFQGSPAPRVLSASASPIGVPFGTSPTGPMPQPSPRRGSAASGVAAAVLTPNSIGCRSPPAPIAALSFRNLPILSVANEGDDGLAALTGLASDPKITATGADLNGLDLPSAPTFSSISVLPDDGPDTGATDQLGVSRLTFSGAVPEVPAAVAARQGEGDAIRTLAGIVSDSLGSPPRSPEQRTSCPASACPSASPVKPPLNSAHTSPSIPAGDLYKQLDAGRPLPPIPGSTPLAPLLSPRAGPPSPSTSHFSPCATDPRASPIKVASTVKRTPGDSRTGGTPWGTPFPSPGLAWPLPPVPFSTGTAAGMAANTIAQQMNLLAQQNRLMPALPNRYSPAAAGFHGVPLVRTQSQTRTLNSPAAAAQAAVQALGGSTCEWYTQPPWAWADLTGGVEPNSLLGTCASAPASTAARTIECGQPSTPRRRNSQNARKQYANSVGGSSTGANYDGPSPQEQELYAQRSQQQYLWDRAREESRNASAAGTPRSARALFMAGRTSGSAIDGNVCFITGNTGLSPVQQVPPPSPRVGSMTSQSVGPFSGVDGNIFGLMDDVEDSWSAHQAPHMQNAACSPRVLFTAVSASVAQFASMTDGVGSPSWGRVSRQLFPSASVCVPMPNTSNGGARVDPLDVVLSRLTVQAPSPVPSPHRHAQKSPQPHVVMAGAAGRLPGVRTSSPLLQTTLAHQSRKTSLSGVDTRVVPVNSGSSAPASRQGYGSSSGGRPPLPQMPMLPPLPRLRSSSQSCPTSADLNVHVPLSFWPGLAPTQNAATVDMGPAGAVLAALAAVAAPPTHQTAPSLPAVSSAVDNASLASLQEEFTVAEQEVGDLPREARTSTPKARGLPVEPLSPRAPTAATLHLQGGLSHIDPSAAAFAEEKPRLSIPHVSPTASPSQRVAPDAAGSMPHGATGPMPAGHASETTATDTVQTKAHSAGASMGGVVNASGTTLQVHLAQAPIAILPETSAPARVDTSRDIDPGRRPPDPHSGVVPSQQPQQQSNDGCSSVGQGQQVNLQASHSANSNGGSTSTSEHQFVVPPGARYAGQYLVPATHLACDPRTGPAVWGVADEEDLLTALNALLRDPVERRSRGHAAAQGAAKLASSLVSTVWTVLEDIVIAPALQKYIATADAP